jgi:cell division protein FtsB
MGNIEIRELIDMTKPIELYIKLFQGTRELLNHPKKVLMICIGFFLFSMLTSGLWWRLWALKADEARRTQVIQDEIQKLQKLDEQLAQAQSLKYIEKQAKDRLDLAAEDDLVFIFSK